MIMEERLKSGYMRLVIVCFIAKKAFFKCIEYNLKQFWSIHMTSLLLYIIYFYYYKFTTCSPALGLNCPMRHKTTTITNIYMYMPNEFETTVTY